jgi:peptide-methionine (R)-S-oxide reductase
MQLSNEEWKKQLTPEQYRVLREKGTEWPFTGKYLNSTSEGVYKCVACGAELFTSESKYNSTIPTLAGWPSFSEVLDAGAVKLQDDDSYGMHRTEIVCSGCGGHLGHLFSDDSSPTGKHYCVSSCAIDFKPESKKV